MITFLLPNVYSQEKQITEGRYISIENPSAWFKEVNGNIEVRDFLLYHINDDESSKPIFMEVNDLSNVVKFSISSSSEAIARTRRCTVIMNKDDYANTFYKVLRKMQVETVFIGGNATSVEDYFKIINEQ